MGCNPETKSKVRPKKKTPATARLGVRDFEIHWISRGFRISDWISVFHVDFWISGFHVDFWILKWISRFQSVFMDFKVDFCIVFKVDLDFWAGHMAPTLSENWRLFAPHVQEKASHLAAFSQIHDHARELVPPSSCL